MIILATYSIKGGVGKTSTAVNLAYLAAQSGARTLLWDMDPQGAATFYYRIEAEVSGGGKRLIRGKSVLDELVRATDFERLHLLPADFSYRHLDLALDGTKRPTRQLARILQPLAESYDVLFLDCAPNISLVSEALFIAADALLVPTVPTTLSLRTLEQLRVHLDAQLKRKERRRLRVLPFFCMVDRRKKLHREVCALGGAEAETFLETIIPYSSIVEQMGPRRAPVPFFAPWSPPARAYLELWREVTAQVPGLRAEEI